MLFKSQLLTQASGSLGGITFAHNKGGMYTRARSIPTNPQTAFQAEVRNAMTASVNRWTSVLTAAQRLKWNIYGENTPTTNKLGDTITLSGQQWYNACNVTRGQALAKIPGQVTGLTLVDTGPTIYNRGDFTTPTSVSIDLTSGFSMEIDNTDDWANEDNAVMLVFQGTPQNVGRTYFNGPWRLFAGIPGDSVTPPTSPVTRPSATLATLGYSVQVGAQTTFAVMVLRADGRTSTRRKLGPFVNGS